MFENINFITTNKAFVSEFKQVDTSALFRKKFNIDGEILFANLSICALGIGYCYINGEKICNDLLTAPFSNYNKTLWYTQYDVKKFLNTGSNVLAVEVGNGFFNEFLTTPWNFNHANWRDNPKFIMFLEITTDKGRLEVTSDKDWVCTDDSPVYFNQLRNGEYFDARKYNPLWNTLDYNDSSWEKCKVDKNPPKGQFRLCECEPVLPCKEYPSISITKTDNSYVFDIGQNISGFVKLKVKQRSGDKLIIKYTEEVSKDGHGALNGLDSYYENGEFQTDILICNGEEIVWSPKFTYHGFRYIEIFGLSYKPKLTDVVGVFIHQSVEELTYFECSNKLINDIFHCGKMSTLSNLHYMPTDCPSREKLGWTNDAQSSVEQMLTNFDVIKLFKKWMVDIKDMMKENGQMSGIAPTYEWGYEGCNGPVCDGVLFEIPYKIYLLTNDNSLLIEYFPKFEKYLGYLKNNENQDGLCEIGLWDWAGPYKEGENAPTPSELTASVLYYHFLCVVKLTCEILQNNKVEYYNNEAERIKKALMKKYIKNGMCTVSEQTAISMFIYYDLYEDLKPLAEQLKSEVIKHNYHHNCGMVGLRRLYYALNKCNLEEYAYKIITAEGFPSYSLWIEKGATTLWEMWQCTDSKNHHMYSDVLSWIMKTIGGIDCFAKDSVTVSPKFLEEIEYSNAKRKFPQGELIVNWRREDKNILLELEIPNNLIVNFKVSKMKKGLTNGKFLFKIQGGEVKCIHQNIQ